MWKPIYKRKEKQKKIVIYCPCKYCGKQLTESEQFINKDSCTPCELLKIKNLKNGNNTF